MIGTVLLLAGSGLVGISLSGFAAARILTCYVAIVLALNGSHGARVGLTVPADGLILHQYLGLGPDHGEPTKRLRVHGCTDHRDGPAFAHDLPVREVSVGCFEGGADPEWTSVRPIGSMLGGQEGRSATRTLSASIAAVVVGGAWDCGGSGGSKRSCPGTGRHRRVELARFSTDPAAFSASPPPPSVEGATP